MKRYRSAINLNDSGDLDAESGKREVGIREAGSRLNRFARRGLPVGIVGVLPFSISTVAFGLPAGTEQLLCS